MSDRTSTKTTKSGITYLTAPLTLDELREMSEASDTGEVCATVGMPLDDIAGGDYEDFLDAVTALVCGEAALLTDISTAAVGVDEDTGKVFVKVWGSLEEWF